MLPDERLSSFKVVIKGRSNTTYAGEIFEQPKSSTNEQNLHNLNYPIYLFRKFMIKYIKHIDSL